MAAIAVASKACFRSFDTLRSSLGSASGEHQALMPAASIDNERGRFRVWCGNLGVFHSGNANLDTRLRDSTILKANALHLLKQLRDDLVESDDIARGARSPYEDHVDAGENHSDGSSSDDSDDDSDREQHTELQIRLVNIQSTVDHLYKLSFRIRNPALRPRSLKATLYEEPVQLALSESQVTDTNNQIASFEARERTEQWLSKLDQNESPISQSAVRVSWVGTQICNGDPTVAVGTFEEYAKYDNLYIVDLLREMGVGNINLSEIKESDVYRRIAKAITARRRRFRYWSRHASKLQEGSDWSNDLLIASDGPGKIPETPRGVSDRVDLLSAKRSLALNAMGVPQTEYNDTIPSKYLTAQDEAIDSQSVVSFASTAIDERSNEADFPPAPLEAARSDAFTCPYCSILCPSRHGKGKAWRAHVTRDLEPYMCTYSGCPDADRTYGSRSMWLQHEARTHRSAWRCHSHPEAIYDSAEAMSRHFHADHDAMDESQIQGLAQVAETTLIDTRETCPICLKSGAEAFPKGLQNHLANHLERIALFALPRGTYVEDESANSQGPRAASQESLLVAHVEHDSHTSLLEFEPEDDETGSNDLEHVKLDVHDPPIDTAKIEEEHSRSSLPEVDEPSIPKPGTSTRLLRLKTALQNNDREEVITQCAQAIGWGEESLLKSHDYWSLGVVNDSIEICRLENRWDLTRQLCVLSIPVSRALLGRNHPKTLAVLHSYARVLQAMGRFDESEAAYRDVVDASREAYGPQDPQTLTVTLVLGAILGEQSKWADEEMLYRKTLGWERDHEKRFMCPFCLHCDTGVAHDLYEHATLVHGLTRTTWELFRNQALIAYTRRQKIGTPSQYQTALMRRLALLLSEQGKDDIDEAIALYLYILEQPKNADKDQLLVSWSNTKMELGILYVKAGKIQQAEPTLLGGINTFTMDYGSSDLLLVRPLQALAEIYYDSDRVELAKHMYQRIVEVASKHPESDLQLPTYNRLGHIYSERLQLDHALDMFQKAADGYERKSGLADERTRQSLSDLGDVLIKLNHLEEAERTVRLLLKAQVGAKEFEHARMYSCLDRLIDIYLRKGSLNTAEYTLTEARKIFGPQHPYPSTAARKLASGYLDMERAAKPSGSERKFLLEASNIDALITGQPVHLRCIFGKVHCTEEFTNYDAWFQHCNSHFVGHTLEPGLLLCGYCDHYIPGSPFWDSLMKHTALHQIADDKPDPSRHEESVFNEIWKTRIISNEEQKRTETERSDGLGTENTTSNTLTDTFHGSSQDNLNKPLSASPATSRSELSQRLSERKDFKDSVSLDQILSRSQDTSMVEVRDTLPVLPKSTSTGCLACRRYDQECGEERPICSNCVKSRRQCGWDDQATIVDPETGRRVDIIDEGYPETNDTDEEDEIPELGQENDVPAENKTDSASKNQHALLPRSASEESALAKGQPKTANLPERTYSRDAVPPVSPLHQLAEIHDLPPIASRKRTRVGCLTCRRRRIKCGQEQPACFNCMRSKRDCGGYEQRFQASVLDPDPIAALPGLNPERVDHLVLKAASRFLNLRAKARLRKGQDKHHDDKPKRDEAVYGGHLPEQLDDMIDEPINTDQLTKLSESEITMVTNTSNELGRKQEEPLYFLEGDADNRWQATDTVSSPDDEAESASRTPFRLKCYYPGCTRVFARASDVQRHVFDAHYGEKHTVYTCPLSSEIPCTEGARSEVFTLHNLRTHLRAAHSIDEPDDVLARKPEGPYKLVKEGREIMWQFDEEEASIYLIDAVGRTFRFPWSICKTLKGMKNLIRRHCSDVDRVREGIQHDLYDLIGPNRQLLVWTDQDWASTVQPEWQIGMRMRPGPKLDPLPDNPPAVDESKSKVVPKRPHVFGSILYGFKAERPDELDVKEGELIYVLAQHSVDWMVARLVTGGEPGLIPASYIQLKDEATGAVLSDGQVIMPAVVDSSGQGRHGEIAGHRPAPRPEVKSRAKG